MLSADEHYHWRMKSESTSAACAGGKIGVCEDKCLVPMESVRILRMFIFCVFVHRWVMSPQRQSSVQTSTHFACGSLRLFLHERVAKGAIQRGYCDMQMQSGLALCLLPARPHILEVTNHRRVLLSCFAYSELLRLINSNQGDFKVRLNLNLVILSDKIFSAFPGCIQTFLALARGTRLSGPKSGISTMKITHITRESDEQIEFGAGLARLVPKQGSVRWISPTHKGG